MAPMNGHKTQARALDSGHVSVHVPPPSSILAMHIAPVNGNGIAHFDEASFTQLIEACLGYDEYGQPSLGTDIDVTHRVICVIAKAGIDPAFGNNDDPFKIQGRNVDGLTKCLEVIDLATQKSPSVLFALPNVDELVLGDWNVPLFAWLIPKLLCLVTKSRDDDNNDSVACKTWSVLGNIVTAAARCSSSQNDCRTVSLFVTSYASEILLQLEKLDLASCSDVNFSLSGPSETFVQDLAKLNIHDTVFDSKMPIGSRSRLVRTTCRLLGMPISQMAATKHSSTMMARLAVSDVLNHFQRLWSVIEVLVDFESQVSQDSALMILDFFDSLLMVASQIVNIRSKMPFVQRYCLLWATCVESSTRLGNGQWDSTLGHAILELTLRASRQIPELGRALDAQLIPLISGSGTYGNSEPSTVSQSTAALKALLDGIKRTHAPPRSTSQIRPEGQDSTKVETAGDVWSEGGRARKRLRLSSDHQSSEPMTLTQTLCSQINMVVCGKETADLNGLSRTAPLKFQKLCEKDQYTVLDLLGQIACAQTTTGDILEDSKPTSRVCEVCDVDPDSYDKSGGGMIAGEAGLELTKVLLALVPLIQKSSRARVIGLLSLRRLLRHSISVDHLELAHSPLGEWCLQSLRSSSREVRIAASAALNVFMLNYTPISLEVTRHNRIIALDFLQTLWIKNDTAVQETAVLALTQIALVGGDEELNIVLVRFVEFLGHSNPYISGLVYGELQKVAYIMKISPATLLRPFWRTIGVTVIKNFHSRPVIAQQLCDLLGLKVEGLLMLIEEYALPYLVLTRKHDVILRIALTHGPTMSVFDLCTQRRNLASILSFLLAQPSPDLEEMIMTLLIDVSPDFSEQDLAGWVRLNPDYIACELLKAVVDAGDSRGSRAYQALHLLAQLDHRKPGHSSNSKKSDIMGSFLEANVLSIITDYSNILIDLETRQPNAEKRRCLAAIGEVMKLGKGRLTVALPQICACLRSAMESKELCNKAFTSWATMISTLKEDDIEPLVDQTFAIIVRGWDSFQAETQQLAYTVVSDLLRKHTSLIRDIYNTVPSLASIPLMTKFETELDALKRQMDERHGFLAFVKRLQNENVAVVEQALKELSDHLLQKQDFLYRSILREQPDSFVADLTRSLLDCCSRFSTSSHITVSCARCLGRIGCLDPNKVESTREKKTLVVLSNFAKADETVDFILHLLEHVVVKAFLSATSTRSQGFLAWAMQELLRLCDLNEAISLRSRAGSNLNYRKWFDLPEAVRNTLTPFLSTRYSVNAIVPQEDCSYPIFSSKVSYGEWLRTMVYDLLEKASSDNAKLIFGICARLVKGQDISIPTFLLPFVALNVIIGGIENEKALLIGELLSVLRQPLTGKHMNDENVRLCSESVFEILDHMSSWTQQRKKQYSAASARAERGIADPSLENADAQIKNVEVVLASVPADLISRRAIDCNSYARALFHWEQYIRQVKEGDNDSDERLERLQEIYSQIDEPDGIEGISAHLHVLNIDQQILEHRKAGRWTAAQSWYEIQLNQKPEDSELQVNLLTCLRESGQYDVLINRFDALKSDMSFPKVVPFAIEASWVMSRWDKMDDYVRRASGICNDFAVGVGKCLRILKHDKQDSFDAALQELYQNTVAGLTPTSISSFQAAHDVSMKLHILTELQDISIATKTTRADIIGRLDQRIDILGSYVSDKQYLLGFRRAVMEVTPAFSDLDVASSWLTTAKLARKGASTNQAFNAVLRASALGDKSATIEQAKLMWKDGHHRKAIQTLEGAIDAGAFNANSFVTEDGPVTLTTDQQQQQNIVTAKAYLLLGKWLDTAGQTQSEVIIKTYRKVTEHYRKWEKGWYHLGKHYNKILDSEKAKPMGKESQVFLTGESSKLVIDNYLRSLICGSNYIFQTLPKVLTLWLELVSGIEQPQDARRGNEKFNSHNAAQRKRLVEETNAQVKKYVDKMQAVVLYTILPQVVARICHPNQSVYNILVSMVVKVVRAFPQQALWPLLAVVKSQSKDRASRGLNIISKIVETTKKSGKDTAAADLRNMITQGQKFSDEILRVSEFPIEGKTPRVSLARDLGFNHKIAPSRLVVPIESCLMPSIPATYEPAQTKTFRPFSKDAVTITAFLDEALVLASLQKPRKLSIRGSDGKVYGVLAKPKDDMRKDQRLMEFNTMINRFLKRDVEASKRRLYIRTYAVVPLNEECGLIEWVDNLKTFRDIILKLYKEKSIAPNYVDIRNLLDEACSGPPEKTSIFNDKVLKNFPPVFHEWFVDTFSDPSAWFTARLRYTRSCAVMSIVGHVLGLGDRHGENILFEEDNGGTLHVDFNCLFDKGLTFEKPECVPFRLTHNIVDAFGAYRHDGPFRRCCEITLTLLRGNEDALMTILETFLHDPTTDFINAGKRKKGPVAGVPDTPIGVLDGVRGKVRGMLAGESVPLSVAGYVEEMIKRATDEANLCRMYIGWCAFF